jgi:hypothetical protein
MVYDQSKRTDRWQALDILKSVGLFAAVFGHTLIWWIGTQRGAAESAFYSLHPPLFWLTSVYTIFIGVHFILISAGVSFYFYLKKYRPSYRTIASRVAVLILVGVLLGLNLHPTVIFWNVFLLYAFSLLAIFVSERYGGRRLTVMLTLCALLFTPLLRLSIGHLAANNYLLQVLVGDPQGKISFYPIFPWFFLVGVGFLIGSFYRGHECTRTLAYRAVGGMVFSVLMLYFLKPLALSNIFGVTSRIPFAYLFLIFTLFILLISLLELLLRNIVLSRYNPVIAPGRHILPVYLITVIATLALYDYIDRFAAYGVGTPVFFILEIATFLIAYLSSALLTYRAERRAQ